MTPPPGARGRGRPVKERPPEEGSDAEDDEGGAVDPNAGDSDPAYLRRLRQHEDPAPSEPPDEPPPGWGES